MAPPAENIDTGNTMIDYILNSKMAEAGRYKIKTCVDVLIPANINVDENTLCTVFLNLFDNAIEASKKENDPDIQVTMKCVQNYLHFVIANKTDPELMKANPHLRTTKDDKNNHGLGMKIVKEAVEKTNGIISHKMVGSYFTVTVMLPMENEPGGRLIQHK
jgi:sensor histidine kinase regulating citrate/malate metabolism